LSFPHCCCSSLFLVASAGPDKGKRRGWAYAGETYYEDAFQEQYEGGVHYWQPHDLAQPDKGDIAQKNYGRGGESLRIDTGLQLVKYLYLNFVQRSWPKRSSIWETSKELCKQ